VFFVHSFVAIAKGQVSKMDIFLSPRRLASRFTSFFSRFRSRRRRTAIKELIQRRKLHVFLENLEDRRLLAAQVWTDKLDYAPGETAIISGSGYAPGETIHLEIVRTDGLPEGTPDNPWDIIDGVTDGGTGDLDGVADGKFTTSW